MAKVKNLGWAEPGDPIYQGGPMIHFKAGIQSDRDNGIKKHHDPQCNVMPTEIGRFAVVLDYYNWEGGSCLDSTAPRIALFPAHDVAEMYFDSKVAELSAAMLSEIGNIAAIGSSHWGLSGYTWYCVMLESDETRDEDGWCNFISADGEDDIHGVSKLVKLFDGCKAKPVDGDFELKRIEFADVEEYVYGSF